VPAILPPLSDALGFWPGLGVGVLATLLGAAAVGGWALRKYVRMERRAADAERMGELGMLTGGLAHEIKNPLSTMGLNLQLLREELDDRLVRLGGRDGDPQVEERRKALARMTRRLDGVTKEAHRLREILDGFLRYAGRVEPQLAPLDLGAMANDLVDFLVPQATAARVKLDVKLPPDPPTIRADEGLVKQATLNLLLNAIQHSPEGGRVTLSVDRDGPGAARLSVSDEGPGVPAEARARLFDPYFTRRKGGTGLGLSITRRIAEAHGGRVVLDDQVPRGATFRLILPSRPGAGRA